MEREQCDNGCDRTLNSLMHDRAHSDPVLRQDPSGPHREARHSYLDRLGAQEAGCSNVHCWGEALGDGPDDRWEEGMDVVLLDQT